MIFFNANIPEIEEFLVFSLKYCINPKNYNKLLLAPDKDTINNYQSRYKNTINVNKVTDFVAFFNKHDPMTTIDNARKGSATARNIKYLSASRYLRYLERMAILKEDYKANRINMLFDDFNIYLTNANINYDIFTLKFFLYYVKNSFLPNRSRSIYVKK